MLTKKLECPTVMAKGAAPRVPAGKGPNDMSNKARDRTKVVSEWVPRLEPNWLRTVFSNLYSRPTYSGPSKRVCIRTLGRNPRPPPLSLPGGCDLTRGPLPYQPLIPGRRGVKSQPPTSPTLPADADEKGFEQVVGAGRRSKPEKYIIIPVRP